VLVTPPSKRPIVAPLADTVLLVLGPEKVTELPAATLTEAPLPKMVSPVPVTATASPVVTLMVSLLPVTAAELFAVNEMVELPAVTASPVPATLIVAAGTQTAADTERVVVAVERDGRIGEPNIGQ